MERVLPRAQRRARRDAALADRLRARRRDRRALAGDRRERAQFLWEGLDAANAGVIRPSLNPLSPKNAAMARDRRGDPRWAGIQPDGDPRATTFTRLDGSPGRVDSRNDVIEAAPLPKAAPLLAQVSHWNHLRDPVGVVDLFAREVAPRSDAHLVVAGPDIGGSADEPEAPTVLAETVDAWERLPERARARVHLVRVPTDDPDEAAAIVNALQRRAAVVVQESRGEGFGMTVLESMWKRRPSSARASAGSKSRSWTASPATWSTRATTERRATRR